MHKMKTLTATLVASLVASACAAPQIAPILREEAFEPITPVMPEEITSVTGSIFADSNARYRFGYKQNFQVGDIITVDVDVDAHVETSKSF